MRASRLETKLIDAQLTTLQHQLQPHFLFNTLHAISTLMRRDVDAADRTLLRLSGVSTTRARLQHLFGADFRFEFHRREPGVSVVVALPWRMERRGERPGVILGGRSAHVAAADAESKRRIGQKAAGPWVGDPGHENRTRT